MAEDKEKKPFKDIFSYLEGKKEEVPQKDEIARKNLGVNDLMKGGASPEILSKAEGMKGDKLSSPQADKENGSKNSPLSENSPEAKEVNGVIPPSQLKELKGKTEMARPEGRADLLGKKAGDSLLKGDKQEKKSEEEQQLERFRKMGMSPEDLKKSQQVLQGKANQRGKMTSKNGKRIPEGQRERQKEKVKSKKKRGVKETAKKKIKKEAVEQIKKGALRRIVEGLASTQSPLTGLIILRDLSKKLFRKS